MERSLIDTGPIVALFDGSDRFHRKLLQFLKKYKGTLYTTWPVITETNFLLQFNIKVLEDFLTWIEAGAIQIIDLEFSDIPELREAIVKYSNVPMDFADASLMQVAEKLDLKSIISLDGDFYVYRTRDGKALKNLLSSMLPNR